MIKVEVKAINIIGDPFVPIGPLPGLIAPIEPIYTLVSGPLAGYKEP